MNALNAQLGFMTIAALGIAWFMRNHERCGAIIMERLFGTRIDLAAPANHMVVVGMGVVALACAALSVPAAAAQLSGGDECEIAAAAAGRLALIMAAIHAVRSANLIKMVRRQADRHRAVAHE